MKHIHCTFHLPLVLEAKDLSFVEWWVDAAFVVHVVTNMSRKQRINIKSSIEAELVGIYDASDQVLWTNYCQKVCSSNLITWSCTTKSLLTSLHWARFRHNIKQKATGGGKRQWDHLLHSVGYERHFTWHRWQSSCQDCC